MIRIGIDLGERFVGLAMHDEPEVPAKPCGAVDLKKLTDIVGAVVTAVKALGAQELIVGLPLNLDGRPGPKAKNAKRFAKALRDRSGLSVVLWDERLTTVQAQRNRAARGAKGREGIDAEAAAILLQSYIDAVESQRVRPTESDEV